MLFAASNDRPAKAENGAGPCEGSMGFQPFRVNTSEDVAFSFRSILTEITSAIVKFAIRYYHDSLIDMSMVCVCVCEWHIGCATVKKLLNTLLRTTIHSSRMYVIFLSDKQRSYGASQFDSGVASRLTREQG